MSDQATPRTDAPTPPLPTATRVSARPASKLERIWEREARVLESDDDSRDDRRPVRRPPDGGIGVWPWSTGVLPRSKVRMACFVVLALSMFASGALCIMAVWNPDQTGVAWKSIASLGIVAALMAGFTLLNEVFGPKKGETTA